MFDENEVREFVKKMGFRPDPSGPDWEERLVDALTGKDKSENAGWGSVYYNSDKVLQFLKKYDMLGPKGINQRQAISKLKRLLKSGKWKEDEDMKIRINENQRVTLTLGQLRRLIKESAEERSPALLKQFKRWAKYLLNVNPKYVTDPGKLIPYLRSPNWDDPDMEYAQYKSTIRMYGNELCDFFEKLRELPDEEADAEYLSLLRDSGVKTDDALD